VSKIPFIYLEFRAYCQATENEFKIKDALRNAIGVDEFDIDKLTGYYGNPILLYSGKIKSKKKILSFFDKFDNADIVKISSGLDQRIGDDLLLHVRLSKQEAYLGKTILSGKGDFIDVAIKIESYPASKDRALKLAREFLGGKEPE